MDWLFGVDWAGLFVPSEPILETVVRGTLMYLGLFAIVRFIMRRQAGSIGVADILVIVVIADAAQNGLAADYHSITEGMILVLTIIFWDFFLDWLAFRVPAVGRVLHQKPLALVRNGRLNRRNLRREYITMDEFMAQLRKQGIDDVAKVKDAFMEEDGQISVIKATGDDDAGARPRKKLAGAG